MDRQKHAQTFQYFGIRGTSVLYFHRGLGATFGGLGASNIMSSYVQNRL